MFILFSNKLTCNGLCLWFFNKDMLVGAGAFCTGEAEIF